MHCVTCGPGTYQLDEGKTQCVREVRPPILFVFMISVCVLFLCLFVICVFSFGGAFRACNERGVINDDETENRMLEQTDSEGYEMTTRSQIVWESMRSNSNSTSFKKPCMRNKSFCPYHTQFIFYDHYNLLSMHETVAYIRNPMTPSSLEQYLC